MEKNVCYISGFFPDSLYHNIIQNSKYNTQHAADKLQKAFLKGIHYYYKNIYVINTPFVGSFPKRYNKLFVPYATLADFKGKSIGFFNLSGVKYLIITNKIKRELINWIHNSKGEKIIIVYSLAGFLIDIIEFVKRNYAEIKIVQIVPDLLQFINQPHSVLLKKMLRYYINKSHMLWKSVDGFVLLNKYMVEHLPISIRPYTVIEGIYSLNEHACIETQKFSSKTILYSGSLARRYGIMNLIKAFILLDEPSYQLIICGSGDCEKEIAGLTRSHKNIIFKGSTTNSDIINFQQMAWLLVNPRTPEGIYTKYSFPSKTIEYMASGTPVLLYKLQGIPEEYYNYCFYIDNDYSVNMLSQTIKKILELKKPELIKKGNEARIFITESKNEIIQCKKMYDLIENL